ncbi:plexin A3-like isoform X2 [Halichondria panicea]
MKTVLSILLLSMLMHVSTSQFTPNTGETFVNMVLSDSKLLLGTSAAVYRVDLVLNQEQRRVMSPIRLLVADSPTGTLNGTVMTCDAQYCYLLETNNLDNTKWQVAVNTVLLPGTGVALGSFGIGPNRTSDITYGEPASTVNRRFAKAALRNVMSANPDDFFRYATVSNGNSDDTTDYLKDVFTYLNYTYFTIQPNNDEVRVVRFCQQERGTPLSDGFSSQFEIKLRCRTENRDITSSSATFRQTSQGPMIFLTVNTMVSMGLVRQEVCSFSVDEINQKMTEKITDCVNARGQAGIETQNNRKICPTHFTSPQKQQIISNQCVLFSDLLRGIEVDESFTQTPLITETNQMTEFTSLLATPLDNQLFLFAGTSSGDVLQYHVTDEGGSELVRTIPVGSVGVVKMLSSDNGEYVYTMSTNTVHRHTVDMCGSYSSCDTCTSSPDPVCGWCVLQGRCTRQSLCPSVPDKNGVQQTVWVQTSGECPVITMATPTVIYLEDITASFAGSLQISVSTMNVISNPLLLGFNYKCRYDYNVPGAVSTSDRTATSSGDSFSCFAPLLGQVPAIPAGRDSVEVTVSLLVGDVSLVTTTTPVEITDCNLLKTCTGCISSGINKCRWCPFSHQCIPDRNPFQCSGSSQEVTIGQNDQCPQITAGSYLVHVDHTYDNPPLRITTSNLSTFRSQFDLGQFECVICEDEGCSNPLFRVLAVLEPSGELVRCEARSYPTALTAARFSAQLQLVGEGDRRIDNPDDTRVMLYDCSKLGTNCGQCLAITSNYSCSYCGTGNSCQLDVMCSGSAYSEPVDFSMCQASAITTFTPSAGPVDGGTTLTIEGLNLGAERGHLKHVTVGEADCAITEYIPGVMVRCVTSSVDSSTYSARVSIRLSMPGGQLTTVTSPEQYNYETPTLDARPTLPSIGPKSGGSNITITGQHLVTGTNHSVQIGNMTCDVIEVGVAIRCTTAGGAVGEHSVRVMVDEWSGQRGSGFTYVDDPTFESIEPTISFAAGGTNFIVRGTNFNSIQNPRLLVYVDAVDGRGKRQTLEQQERTVMTSPTCVAVGNDGSTLSCPAPDVTLNDSTAIQVGFGLLMDGVVSVQNLNGTLVVYPNPTFQNLAGDTQFKFGDPIIITLEGSGFKFSVDQVRVRVAPCSSGYCDCEVNIVTNQETLSCEVTATNDLMTDTPLTVTVHIGNFSTSVGDIIVASNIDLLITLLPIFVGVVLLSVAVFIVLVAVFCRNTRRKDQRYEQLILELEKLESSVARECKLGFAELQTDLDDITDIAGCRLPYRDMQNYLMATMFPGARDHPVLHPIQAPSHRLPQLHRALEDFNGLVHDKNVLVLMIRSMEQERGFTIRDKSLVGSLLVVALINRFDYATDVLKSLLSDVINKTVTSSSPKLLLRRTETVAERMLTNWLAFCLHGYIMEHVGQPLYLTYRAVKTQLEKGPIDVITGEARYSLSEQKLIRQKVDVEVLDVFVDSEDGLRVPVKLLDCDTMSQIKEKLLDATFKTAPISQRPSLKSIDLVYVQSPQAQMILRDEDTSMVKEGVWKKINTLKHYGIRSGALFRIVRRKEHAPPGRAYDHPGSLISSHAPRQRGLSEAEDGFRVWHLFKQNDDDARKSPFLNKKLVTEIYLPRMLSTKSILQKFVDDLFTSLFTVSHPPVSPTGRYGTMFPQSPAAQGPMGYAPGADSVPMAIKYLFDFLDDEADSARVVDTDVVHMWKNNALSLRFWVNMIKNPEFVFDINKSHTVDACLSVIAQAFIDGCSFADTKLNIDSPTSKLLYNKEVQGYRAQVKQYYQDIHNLPKVPEDDMQSYLKQLSVHQNQMTRNGGGFVVESALYELLRYASKYNQQITSNLRLSGLEAKAQLFDGIVKVFQT